MSNNIIKPSLLKTGGSLTRAIEKDTQSKTGTAMPIETLVIALDCSGSMRDETPGAQTMLHAAIDSAKMLVSASLATARVGAVAFTDQADEVISPTIPRSQLKERLAGFHRHEGGTIFYPAVTAATVELEKAGLPGTLRRIVFMSDGKDQESYRPQLMLALKRCVDQKIIIDTVAFGAGAGHDLLKLMSKMTGGVFVFAKDAHELRKAFLALEAGVRGLLPKITK